MPQSVSLSIPTNSVSSPQLIVLSDLATEQARFLRRKFALLSYYRLCFPSSLSREHKTQKCMYLYLELSYHFLFMFSVFCFVMLLFTVGLQSADENGTGFPAFTPL